ENIEFFDNGFRFVAKDLDSNSNDINLRTQSMNNLNENAIGVYSSEKSSSELTNVYKNGEVFYNYASGGVLPNANLLLGAVLNKSGEEELVNGYSIQKVGFFSIGKALLGET